MSCSNCFSLYLLLSQALASSSHTVPLRVVHGNNGGVPCQHYCVGINGGPWNGELPIAWDGASCAATSDPSISCYDYSTAGTPISCTCGPTGAGWNKAPFNSAGMYVLHASMFNCSFPLAARLTCFPSRPHSFIPVNVDHS